MSKKENVIQMDIYKIKRDEKKLLKEHKTSLEETYLINEFSENKTTLNKKIITIRKEIDEIRHLLKKLM